MKHNGGTMPDHLRSLVETVIGSLPVKDPHVQQQQQQQIVCLHPINHMEPFSPAMNNPIVL